MPAIQDFRLSPFHIKKVSNSGVFIGKNIYWKLYSIENIFRVIIHSVLSIQIPEDWWSLAVDETIKKRAARFQNSYLKKPWHGKPGKHGIYYVDLKDLNEIIRANVNLFDPVIPNLDRWIVGIEDLRLPRNIVAHMNFSHKTDKKRIDLFYEDCVALISEVEKKINLSIP